MKYFGKIVFILSIFFVVSCSTKNVSHETKNADRVRVSDLLELSDLLKYRANAMAIEADELRNEFPELARLLYERAAELGNAKAHYALSNLSPVSGKEILFHLQEAALMGYQEAITGLIDYFFLPSDRFEGGFYDDVTLDAVDLTSLIEKLLVEYPETTVDERKYSVIKKAAEAGSLDLNKFFKKYGIQYDDDPYFLWELAEEASRQNGRFRGPNMHLTFQLISRGGNGYYHLELEKIQAIEDYYYLWKNNIPKEFYMEEYSPFNDGPFGAGGRWAYGKKREREIVQRAEEFNAYLATIPSSIRELLKEEEKAFYAYLEGKVHTEEVHDGSGAETWALGSLDSQQREHLETMKKLLNKEIDLVGDFVLDNESELQRVYASVIEKLRNRSGLYFTIENIENTAKLWFTYREKLIELLLVARPDITIRDTRIWVSKKRIEDLRELLGSIDYVLRYGRYW